MMSMFAGLRSSFEVTICDFKIESPRDERFLTAEQRRGLRRGRGGHALRSSASPQFPLRFKSVSLQINNLMLIRSQIDCVINPIDNVSPMSRDHRNGVDAALLQSLFRVEEIKR